MPKIAVVLLAFALVSCNDSATMEEPEEPESPEQPAPPPEISSFTASPSSITKGESVTLLAVFSNGSGQVDNGVGTVTSNEPVSASPPTSTTYLLTVTNDDGDSVSASVDVNVEPSPIAVVIVRPDEGSLSGSELLVGALVESEFDISAVTAEVEDQSVPLEFVEDGVCDTHSRCNSGFRGELSLTGLPSGPHVVTVTAEDIAGNIASRQRSFMLDRRPILIVTEPLDYSVARPELPVQASCTDDLGGCEIRVWWEEWEAGPLLASAENELSQVLDLAEFEGQARLFVISAEDTQGQDSLSILDLIFVDSSERLTNERRFPTLVIDFDGERALLERTIDDSSDLTILDIDSGSEMAVDVPQHFEILEAFLSPTGAIFSGWQEGDSTRDAVYDWNNSLLMQLPSATSLGNVAGDYALWSDGTRLWRRQFSTMSDLQVSDMATSGDVASNGVVMFSARPSGETHNQIIKFEDSVYTTLTADADIHNLAPRTDGQGVVYRKTGAAGHTIAFHDGTNETVLTTKAFPENEAPHPNRAFPGKDYAIAGGWVAFIEPGADLRPDVWTREPSGTVAQRTAFSADTRIETLAPDGEVMVKTSEKRYLSLPGLPPAEVTEVSSRLGQSTAIDDTWYVSIGRSVFQVQ